MGLKDLVIAKYKDVFYFIKLKNKKPKKAPGVVQQHS